MRFFKPENNFSWKYIVGEVLLIFIGINLAIWFNNWNTSKKIDHDKNVAIVKIKEEIETNNTQLLDERNKNQRILSAFAEYKNLFDGNTSAIITTPKQQSILHSKYPGFYNVTDSIEMQNGLFHYNGGMRITLEIPILTNIAWETSKAIAISNEFSYECLYELASMYNLQSNVLSTIDNAANALQKREIKELMNILNFLEQLELPLMDQYSNMLETIDSCG